MKRVISVIALVLLCASMCLMFASCSTMSGTYEGEVLSIKYSMEFKLNGQMTMTIGDESETAFYKIKKDKIYTSETKDGLKEELKDEKNGVDFSTGKDSEKGAYVSFEGIKLYKA